MSDATGDYLKATVGIESMSIGSLLGSIDYEQDQKRRDELSRALIKGYPPPEEPVPPVVVVHRSSGSEDNDTVLWVLAGYGLAWYGSAKAIGHALACLRMDPAAASQIGTLTLPVLTVAALAALIAYGVFALVRLTVRTAVRAFRWIAAAAKSNTPTPVYVRR